MFCISQGNIQNLSDDNQLFGYLNEKKTVSYTATFSTFGGLEIIGGLIFGSVSRNIFVLKGQDSLQAKS